MTSALAVIAYAGAIAVAFSLLIGAALRAAHSLGARSLTAAAEVSRPDGEAAVASHTAPRRGDAPIDEHRWREELFELASRPCTYDAEGEGRPCALIPDLDRYDWCADCLASAAMGRGFTSLDARGGAQ